MSARHFNFKIGRAVPLLTEAEWQEIEPMLEDRICDIQGYRAKHQVSLAEALVHAPSGQNALAKYKEITGEVLDHPDQLWAVRMSNFGAPCPQCSKPFRTPRAKLCAECGHQLPDGKVAGPLG